MKVVWDMKGKFSTESEITLTNRVQASEKSLRFKVIGTYRTEDNRSIE